jgi:hypothetical protein
MSALSNETANLLQRVEALRGQYERGRSESLTGRAAAEWRVERDANERKAQPPIAPVRADSEQIEQREMADANPWPKPDQRIVEDGRASPPTLDNDAQPAGWGEWIAKEAAARDCPRDYLGGVHRRCLCLDRQLSPCCGERDLERAPASMAGPHRRSINGEDARS